MHATSEAVFKMESGIEHSLFMEVGLDEIRKSIYRAYEQLEEMLCEQYPDSEILAYYGLGE